MEDERADLQDLQVPLNQSIDQERGRLRDQESLERLGRSD